MRVTLTMIVFCILALVTTPTFCWRGRRAGVSGRAFTVSVAMFRPYGAFAQQRLDARQVSPGLAQAFERLGLAGGELETKAEDLLAQLALLDLELLGVHLAELLNPPRHQNPPARVTNRVRMGSLCAAKSMASVAVARSTPAISNSTRPGLTTATQCSGGPLPLPMRVSAGFLVKGLSGKTRIQSLPPRLINRVMATRAASICRSVIQAGSSAFRPYSPKESSPPRRPRCCLRYFTFFGINMISYPLSRRPKPRLYAFIAGVWPRCGMLSP